VEVLSVALCVEGETASGRRRIPEVQRTRVGGGRKHATVGAELEPVFVVVVSFGGGPIVANRSPVVT
jgi:hypothetical protein